MIEPTPHYAGELAYFDTISAGMVPVKVIKVLDADNITFRVTAKRRAYDRGEILTASTPWVCPRTSVYVRDGKYRIRMDYKWMPSQ